MIRSRVVQELRHGLIWRLAEADNPARPVLESFVRRIEAEVPESESWLRLENVPVWNLREAMTWVVGSHVNSIAWAPPKKSAMNYNVRKTPPLHSLRFRAEIADTRSSTRPHGRCLPGPGVRRTAPCGLPVGLAVQPRFG
jgi:hypothetical protein